MALLPLLNITLFAGLTSDNVSIATLDDARHE
jgi:hypothetical protein